MRLRHAPIALAALLGGCAVGPAYHRPETAAPAAFRGQTVSEARSLADVGWWRLYDDPTLASLVREALTNGDDARIAAARVEEARGLAVAARGELWPTLGYSANADRGRNALLGQANPSGVGATLDTFDGFLSAAWQPDIWGRIRRLDEAARDQYLGTQEAQRGVLLSLVGDVASDYFQLLELNEELAISREASDSFGQSLALFEERLHGGIASMLETSTAQAAQAQAAAQIPELEREITLLENQLSVLLGRPPGPIELRGRLFDHAPAPDVPAGLPSQLLERRPDVLAAEYAAKAANADVGVAIGNFLPSIGLSALLGGVSQQLQDVTTHRAALWSAGAQVTGPLFQGGALHGEYVEAKAAWEAAKLQYEETALDAFADAASALATRQRLAEVLAEQEKEVGAYREAVTVALERYKAGEASYYELLQVQQELFPAESALARTRRDELISVVQLYEALGGGWNLKNPSDWLGPK